GCATDRDGVRAHRLLMPSPRARPNQPGAALALALIVTTYRRTIATPSSLALLARLSRNNQTLACGPFPPHPDIVLRDLSQASTGLAAQAPPSDRRTEDPAPTQGRVRSDCSAPRLRNQFRSLSVAYAAGARPGRPLRAG